MTGAGTALNPYIIWDLNDLQAMANGAPYAPNAFYELGADIDALATTTWNWNAGRGVFEGFIPRSFTGNFNGRYHIISGLYMDRYQGAGNIAVGLFSDGTGATIQNLFLFDVDITSYSQGVDVANNTGALVGYCGANTIARVITTGTVVATNNDTNFIGPAHGNCNAGGMLGQIYGNAAVDQCASYVNVTGIALGDARAYTGGFVGNIIAFACWIRNCYSRGQALGGISGGFYGIASAGNIDNCYSTGVAGTGGFGGGGGPGTLTDSFWDIETSGLLVSAGGTGRTTAVMKTQANYTAAGWDFAVIWRIDLTGYWNDGYPYFSWNGRPTIQVLSPNGGEVWQVGSDHNILWTHTKDPGANVRIELLLAGALDEILIASTPIGPVGGGTYLWSIPAGKAPSTFYRIRITSTTAPVSDDSDNDFTIRVPSLSLKVATLPATEIR